MRQTWPSYLNVGSMCSCFVCHLDSIQEMSAAVLVHLSVSDRLYLDYTRDVNCCFSTLKCVRQAVFRQYTRDVNCCFSTLKCVRQAVLIRDVTCLTASQNSGSVLRRTVAKVDDGVLF